MTTAEVIELLETLKAELTNRVDDLIDSLEGERVREEDADALD